MTDTLDSFEQPQAAQPFEYELLKGHYRTNNTFKNDEQLRSEYVHLTDELIRKMTEGVSVFDKNSGEHRVEKPDVVVWLDKSARPVSWLTKDLWPTLAADADGNVPKMPDFRFVNIDREQWVNTIDPDGTGFMNVDLVSPSVVRSLRSVFISPKLKEHGLSPELDNTPTELDGKTILIVDEVKSTGKTLDAAAKFFARAFPEAKIASTHWMSAETQLKDSRGFTVAKGNADLPVWYKEHDIKGRGVGNRDERLSRQSHSRTQKLGAWFLSTRLSDNDPESRQLRKELKQLAADVADKKVLVLPSKSREIEDAVERVERLNGMTLEEFKIAKSRLNEVAANPVNQSRPAS